MTDQKKTPPVRGARLGTPEATKHSHQGDRQYHKRQHVLSLSDRTLVVVIHEEPKRTFVRLMFSRYGEMTPSDGQRLDAWMTELLSPYEGDGIPIVLDHPKTGERATVTDDGYSVLKGVH